jgi:hypothetical protein
MKFFKKNKKMNKVLIGIFCLSLISCNSDNDSTNDNTNAENNIVGVWKFEKEITISGADGITVLREYFPDDCKKQGTYEFTSNGKYIMNAYNTTNQGCEHSNGITDYTYVKNENKLIIGDKEAKIIELTNNKLVMSVPDNYDYNDDGIDDYLEYTFKK